MVKKAAMGRSTFTLIPLLAFFTGKGKGNVLPATTRNPVTKTTDFFTRAIWQVFRAIANRRVRAAVPYSTSDLYKKALILGVGSIELNKFLDSRTDSMIVGCFCGLSEMPAVKIIQGLFDAAKVKSGG